MSNMSRAVSRVKDRMRDGGLLMMMNTVHGQKWYILSNGYTHKWAGKEITEDLAKAVIKEEDVREGKDGLFPGVSQTYRIA
jgi:hypothetical protein